MSKMIRKTLSLVLALSLVYLMSASAFAANTYSNCYDISDGTVEVYAYIDESITYGDTYLNSSEFGEAVVSVDAMHTPDANGNMHKYESVTDLSYASVQINAPAGTVFKNAHYNFYATTPSGDYVDDYGSVIEP